MGAFKADTEKPTTLWSNHKDWLQNLARELTREDRERIRQGGKRLAEVKHVAWLHEFAILEDHFACMFAAVYNHVDLGAWEKVCHWEQDKSDQFRAPRRMILTWQCSYLSSELNLHVSVSVHSPGKYRAYTRAFASAVLDAWSHGCATWMDVKHMSKKFCLW